MSTREAPRASPDYYRTVERAFLELRGGGMILTPADWDVVCRWEERGIPLEVVLAGIRTALSGRIRGSPRTPLEACSTAVEAAFDAARRRRTGVPVPSAHAETGSGRGLEALAGRLREWAPPEEVLADAAAAGPLRTKARAAAERLERLGNQVDGGRASVEDTLRDIEGDLLTGLEAALRDSVRSEIEAEARRTLEPYRARMPASTWRDAFRQAFRQRVSRVSGLDRIALSD